MRWDLTHILPSLDEKDTRPAFEALERCVRRVETAKGRLDRLTREDIVTLLHALGELREAMSRLGHGGSLAFAVDTSDDKTKTFMERARAANTEAANRTRFFAHWLKSLADAEAERLMPANPELAHFVRTLRKAKPYTLSEPLEEMAADKDMAGISAVREAREIITSTFKFRDPKGGQLVTQSEIARHVHAPDRELRRAAYREMFRVYGEHQSVLAHLYRAIVRDWNTEHLKHRKYPRSMTPMNLDNEVADEVVTTMLDACVARRELWQGYFAWKAQRVGAPFSRYDLYAPIEAETIDVPYEEAQRTVLRVFEGFHPRYANLARRVFDERHVDPFPGPTKRGGAFCATVLTRMTPYVLLNHTDDSRSVSTLAHELGHAIHSMLAEDRHPLVSSAPLPLAETASIFSELLLHHHLVHERPEAATAITNERLGDLYATIQRQAYFARFETEAHALVMEGAETRAIDDAYVRLLNEQFGRLEVPPEFAKEWLLIPHFNASPFYVSSYSFGALLSLSLYQRYAEDPAFAPTILDILASGGSRDPQELLADHDIDITTSKFWLDGLDVVAGMLETLKRDK